MTICTGGRYTDLTSNYKSTNAAVLRLLFKSMTVPSPYRLDGRRRNLRDFDVDRLDLIQCLYLNQYFDGYVFLDVPIPAQAVALQTTHQPSHRHPKNCIESIVTDGRK